MRSWLILLAFVCSASCDKDKNAEEQPAAQATASKTKPAAEAPKSDIPEGWIEFSDPGGKYTAIFPGQPQHSSEPASEAYGVKAGGAAYTVSTGPLPEALKEMPVEQLLEESVKSNAPEGSLLESKATKHGPHPARDFRMVVGDKLVFAGRTFVANNLLYSVAAGWPKTAAEPQALEAFVEGVKPH